MPLGRVPTKFALRHVYTVAAAGSDLPGSLLIGSGGVSKTQALIDVGFLKETAIGGAPLG